MRENIFCLFLFHILMPYNIILYFCLPYFHVSNCALFSTKYFSTLILYTRSLDTFYPNVEMKYLVMETHTINPFDKNMENCIRIVLVCNSKLLGVGVGGYSIYVRWYIWHMCRCFDPLFDLLRIKHNLFGVLFFSSINTKTIFLGYQSFQN